MKRIEILGRVLLIEGKSLAERALEGLVTKAATDEGLVWKVFDRKSMQVSSVGKLKELYNISWN